MNDLLIQRRLVLRAFRNLRTMLRSCSIKRLHRETGLSRMTLTRIRDGVSSPTFVMYDKIMKVVIADAVAASAAQRTTKRDGSGSEVNR